VKLDDEIDRLYQLPLEEFTPARNALAKQARGADATAVRTLQKPSVPAWAVNQLYWQERRVYDQLIDAAERLRKTHHSLLAGKSVDLHAAEAEHREKARAALQQIRQILTAAGESQSPANMTAISETLEALPPAEDKPGHLTRPLKRMGFEALAGIAPRTGGAPARKLALVSSRQKDAPPAKPAISEAKKREIEEIETRLTTAQTEERQLQSDIERARRELQRAETAQQRVEEELTEATAKVKQVQADLTAREKAHKALTAEQEKLEQRLEKLRPV
jgi:valyl-tRNA synthetase